MADKLPSPLLSHKKRADDPKKIGLWKIGRTIGKGSSGRVKIARHSKMGQYAAIKIISKTALDSRISLNHLADETERNQLAIEREIVVMKLIDHPNIMRLYDVWETSTELYLILEYIQGGELFDYLCNKGRLCTSEALGYFQQIIGAIDYCHRFNIAHRDLKPENILLDQDLNVKIADFGMAGWQVNNQDGMLRTSCGSPHYAAPEIIGGGAYNGSAADIWSCGIILYALLVGKLPFDDEDCPTLLEKVVKGNFEMPSDIVPLAQDLIRQMLTTDVAKRITMPDILVHPFFTSQLPKVTNYAMPNLNTIARPIGSRGSIDPDIFANLRTLWHGTPDEEIMDSLINDKPTWQKGIYHLLIEYRTRHLEDYQEEETEVTHSRLVHKKSKRVKAEVVRISADISEHKNFRASPWSIPPRDGPPTPRRAARDGPRSAMSSTEFIHQQGTRTPDITLPSLPCSPESPLPISPFSPIWDTLNIPPLTVPDLQDDKIQAFFHQIVNHLNVLQAQTGTPNLRNWVEPLNPVDILDRLDDDRTPANASSSAHYQRLGHEETEIPANGTKPLSVRGKQRQRPTAKLDDKENVKEDDHLVFDGTNKAMKRSSLRNGNGGRPVLKGKQVQIVEPTERERSKLRKKRSIEPISPAFSDAGSTFTLSDPSPSSPISSSPKRGWLGNVFRFKPVTYTLLSTHDAQITLNECRRLLMGMDVRVVLEASDGMGVLKCRIDEVKNPVSSMKMLKAVKFRAELHKQPTSEDGRGHAVSLTFTQERGSFETFKEIHRRLQKAWILDVLGSNPPREVAASPGMALERKFMDII